MPNSIYACVPVATLVYIVVDLYAEINSLAALLRSVSFWILWLLFAILNGVSFVLLKTAVYPGSAPGNGALQPVSPTGLLLLFFSTIGTFSIIQSFSLKFASYKAIDLQQMFEKLRAAVLEEAGTEKAHLDRRRKLRLARRLTAHYTAHPDSIDSDYALAVFARKPSEKIAADIAQASLNPGGKIPTLVNRMGFTDERGARQFLP